MQLSDWIMISRKLAAYIDQQLNEMSTGNALVANTIQMATQNVVLHINWTEMNTIYTDLLKIPTTEMVHPFVMHLKVKPLSPRRTIGVDASNQQETNRKPLAKYAEYNLKNVFVVIEKLNVEKLISHNRRQHGSSPAAEIAAHDDASVRQMEMNEKYGLKDLFVVIEKLDMNVCMRRSFSGLDDALSTNSSNGRIIGENRQPTLSHVNEHTTL